MNPHVLLKSGAPDEKWSVRIFPIKRPEIAVHPQVADFLLTQTILLVLSGVIPCYTHSLPQFDKPPHYGWLMLVVYNFCFGCTPSAGPWYRTCKRPGYFQPPRPRTSRVGCRVSTTATLVVHRKFTLRLRKKFRSAVVNGANPSTCKYYILRMIMIYSNLTAVLLANIPVITAGDSSNNAKLHLVWDSRPSKWIKFPPVQTTVESSKHIHHWARISPS